ncbi:MAG: response regulator [Candidatus Omnitrophica bacterium]|nr:response regulator [Candidatus Omnitrophota bacterium]
MKKILIVDDEPDVRALLNSRLAANGFEILEAPDGPSGIAVAREEKPDLILLDILMPNQDGVETYHTLREDPITQRIPVIFLTALSQDISVTQKSLDLTESYAILGKPYRAAELIQKVRTALGEPMDEGEAG